MKKLTADGEIVDIPPPFFKTPYNHDTLADAKLGALICKDPTLCQQHEAEQADINTIAKNFGLTGKLPIIDLPPSLDRFGEIFDFQDAMNVMTAAKNSFMQMPAEIRAAFQNDPNNFVATVDAMTAEQDPARLENNLAALRAMGLAVQPGPVADKTTLGDVLKAIKEQGAPKASPAPKTPETAPPGP